MYGMVNLAVRDLVITQFGESTWQTICEKAGVGTTDFVALKAYPDSVTYSLVGSASELLKVAPEQILHTFGEHWVRYTAHAGYGVMMDMFGRDFRTCLKNLNGMHSHMGAMMPELVPPRFTVDEVDATHLRVHYFSTREGLAPFVTGLLVGLAHKFGDTVTIQHHAKGTRSDHDEFDVTFQN
jgi:hypothetical protein